MLSNSIVSFDPVVRRIAEQWSTLNNEQKLYASFLTAYAEQIRTIEPQAAISPLEHYCMLDQEDCGCGICMDWALRRREFIRVAALVPPGHRWTVCACDTCRFVGRFQLNLLAAANRRELLIEMSFHARYHSRHGKLVMAWLAVEMQHPSYTINWCAQEMSRFPMERWIKRCETAVSGAVSGAVFVNSTMMTDMVINLGSSLNADVDSSNWI